jgi:hypothetical protein
MEQMVSINSKETTMKIKTKIKAGGGGPWGG